jgi:hypothetical protein
MYSFKGGGYRIPQDAPGATRRLAHAIPVVIRGEVTHILSAFSPMVSDSEYQAAISSRGNEPQIPCSQNLNYYRIYYRPSQKCP